MMMHMPMFVLDQLFDNQEPSAAGCPPTSCRSNARAAARSWSGPRACALSPKAPAKSPVQEREPVDTVRRANVRELSDTYLLWADLPGLARDDLKVTIMDGYLHITGQQKARDLPTDASAELQAALRARPRKAVDIKAPLKKDAKLDGIRAKLVDGELTITIPKQVPQHFSIPVLGGEEQTIPNAIPATLMAAQTAAVPEVKPAKDAPEPDTAADKPTVAELPYPDHLAALRELSQEAEESRANSDSAAAPAETAEASAAASTSERAESDGSWEDVSDEERAAERQSRRRKGSLPPDGPVLEEIAQQELAQQASSAAERHQDAAA